jgi:hypothetical protein
MDRLGIAEAFARYGATLRNVRWAVSAIAADGSLVMSCWDFGIKTANKVMHYRDRLSEWSGGNVLGSDLLRGHLIQGSRDNLPVRLVIAHPASADHSRIAEYFFVRPEVIGRITSFDGDQFTFEFVKASPGK